ncbi:hypothetical protein BC332_06521 [Capsicum chinense]|nr:hypothetical protein BC332_06521 [Capsicum chinense]
MEVKNKYVAIKANINGAPEESDFEIKVENLSLMVEPESKVIDTYGVGRVLVSHRPDFKKDDLVAGFLTWGEYTIVKEGSQLNKLYPSLEFPLSYHVGVFGFSGLAAYGGFFEVCKPKPGEKVFVSAASSSIGHLIGQYAKLLGCYVVGSAGSQEKGLMSTLTTSEARCQKQHMNSLGRVAICGVISEYTYASTRAAPEMLDIVYKRIRIQGFLTADLMTVYADFLSKTVEYLHDGKLKAIEDISQGVESIPSAFIGLFNGNNIGKKIVKVADE